MSRRIAIVAVVFGASLLGIVPNSGRVDLQAADLQGSWKTLSLHRDGKQVDRNGFYAGILIYDNKIVFDNRLAEALTLTYRTNSAKTPKHLDVFDERGTKLLFKGIYELNDDVLKFCYVPDDGPRPDAFVTKPRDGRDLFVLKRRDPPKRENRVRQYRVRRKP